MSQIRVKPAPLSVELTVGVEAEWDVLVDATRDALIEEDSHDPSSGVSFDEAVQIHADSVASEFGCTENYGTYISEESETYCSEAYLRWILDRGDWL